jgi:hypothetical protein
MNKNVKILFFYITISFGLGGVASKIGYDRYYKSYGLSLGEYTGSRNPVFSYYYSSRDDNFRMDDRYGQREQDDALRPIHQFTEEHSYLTFEERDYNIFFKNLILNSLKLLFLPLLLSLLYMNITTIKGMLSKGISNYVKKLNSNQKKISAITTLLIGFVLAMAISSSIDNRGRAFNFQDTWLVWVFFIMVIGYLEYKIFEN